MKQEGRLLALLPFFVFVGLFFVSAVWFDSQFSPIYACLVAIIVSFFTFGSKIGFNKKVKVFIEGCSNHFVVVMTLIFIEASIFTYVLKLIGATESAACISLTVLPCHYVLPGFFVITAIFATAIGSSMGTIATFLPIGVVIAQKIGFPLPFMAGTVVGAAMLGDNLSFTSDTTIASTKTTGSKPYDKFIANLFLVAIASLLTIIALMYANSFYLSGCVQLNLQSIVIRDFIVIVPYVFVLTLAFLGFNIVGVLLVAIMIALGLGVVLGEFSFLESTMLPLKGFVLDRAIDEVMIVALLISGLSRIVEFNGGITYILRHVGKNTKTKGGAEVASAVTVFLVNVVATINTLAILIAGPFVHRIGNRAGIENKRQACLLDIFSSITQGILPYAPQLLLAQSIIGISSIAIIPYLYYQGFIFLVMIFSIGLTFWDEKKSLNGS